jgi:hypothetical protein
LGTERFRAVLRAASAGLQIPDPMVTHRLRHTYATSLLNAGMSMVGVMHLLGHRDIQMTLRYAAVTQETVSREFFEAMTMLEERYALPDLGRVPVERPFDPVDALNDLMRWLKKRAAGERERTAWLLMRRVENLREEVRELASTDEA